jgi:hypothetical protein
MSESIWNRFPPLQPTPGGNFTITDEQSDADAKTITDYLEANEKERRIAEANAIDKLLGIE